MVEGYYNGFSGQRILESAINLRFGYVAKDDLPSKGVPEGMGIWLSQNDFKEIIKRAINFNGFASVPCVSNNSDGFVGLSLLEKTLDYVPVDDSSKI